jgi:hypothetical protein
MAQPRRNLSLTVEILRQLAAPSGPDWMDLEAVYGAEVFQWHVRDLADVDYINVSSTANIIADGSVESVPFDVTNAGRGFLEDVQQPDILERLKAEDALREVDAPLNIVAASIRPRPQQN